MTLAYSLDPLIAEAKQRMRRRRLLLLALLAVLVGAVALGFALRPFGGSPSGQAAQSVRSSQALARLTVPIDATERQWRATVRSEQGSAAARSTVRRLRHRVLSVATATDATLVRIRIWRRTSPLAVELVVATNVDPAVYLRHRAELLVRVLAGRADYVKVVDGHGASFFDTGGVANEGFVGTPPALEGCSPVKNWGPTPPPCPVK
jgi:hypothetical protein